ncbi:MAG TPA: hypothetical protein VGF67_33270 [Ktedonobacteraceae bacterium]
MADTHPQSKLVCELYELVMGGTRTQAQRLAAPGFVSGLLTLLSLARRARSLSGW